MSVWLTIYYIFSYLIFFYTLLAMGLLLYLSISSIRYQRKLRVNLPDDETIRYMLKTSPLTPPVSVIASAYNEEYTIKDNINSLLRIDYPNYDIIIVNDESTDDTMKVLIEEFNLAEVPYTDTKKVPSKPIKAVYRSLDPKYSKLTVVDKEHAGTKSDGINAGINVSDSPYFVNTDVDCIVEPMAIYRMMWLVINSHVPMIGVGATMLMVNGCKVEDGIVTRPAVANNPLPWFQQMEYMRSFLIGKMGWIANGALPNISGGFGLFNTDIVVKSGGYDPSSFAEDVDMLLRMVTYMKETGQDFRLGQVPQVCCWTEGPFVPHSIYRQRTRWARGLFEIVSNHRKMFFNARYGVTGAFTLPYLFFFEFIAPILEAGGMIFMIWLIYTGRVNWNTTFVIFAMIFVFSISLSFVVIVFDYATRSVKWTNRPWSYLKLMIAGILEPILYHPFITFFSIIGYIRHLRHGSKVWAQIKRRGSKKRQKKEEENKEASDKNVRTAEAVKAAAAANMRKAEEAAKKQATAKSAVSSQAATETASPATASAATVVAAAAATATSASSTITAKTASKRKDDDDDDDFDDFDDLDDFDDDLDDFDDLDDDDSED